MIACATIKTSNDKDNENISETDEENENENNIHNNNNQHQCFVEEQNQRSGYNQEGGLRVESSQEEDRVGDSQSGVRPLTSPFSPTLQGSTIEESPAIDQKHLSQVDKISEFAINNSPTVICAISIGEELSREKSFNYTPDNDEESRFRSDDDDDDDEVEEEEEEEEEQGPALVIAKSLDEADEEPIQSYKRRPHLDPDEYNPDSEYLSDPDFHDERPAKIFNKNGKIQAKNSCQGSEELACSSSGLSKTSQILGHSNSDYIEDKEGEEGEDEKEVDLSLEEESFNVEYCIKLPKKESHQDIEQIYEIIELRSSNQDSGESVAEEEEEEVEEEGVGEGEDSESCSEAVSVEVSSDRENSESEEEEEESIRELSQEDHSSNSLEEEQEKPIVQVRHSIEERVSERHNEREFTSSISPYLVENNDGDEQEDVGPTENVSFSFVTEADTEYGISTLKSSEIKPVISSRVTELRRLSSTQDNELSSSECQVTASEARPELYVEESTLAEELTSIQDEQESQSSCMLVDSLTPQNDDDDDYNELNATTGSEGSSKLVGTVVDEMLTGSAATLMQLNQDKVSRIIQRQESLDDIESEVLDLQPELGQIENQSTNNSSCSFDQTSNTNSNNNNKILDDGYLNDTEKKTKMLIDLVSDYCDKLVEQIKDEAIKQIDLITSNKQNIYHLNLSHTFEVSSKQIFNEITDESRITSNSKKIYTSSMYYNDNQDSFPTIEQQVEQCRTIARQLEGEEFRQDQLVDNIDSQQGSQKNDHRTTIADDSIKKESENNNNKNKQASLMFKRRRDRMNRFTFESSSFEEIDNDGCDDGRPIRTRRASLEPNLLFSATSQDERLSLNKANSFTQYLESVGSDLEDSALTDTEYEAPRVRRRATPSRATTTPFRELRRTSRHVEMEVKDTDDNIKDDNDTYPVVDSVENIVPEKRHESSQGQDINDGENQSSQLPNLAKFKPFLDSTTLKDIERLRHWSPYGAFNEHNSVSPEECLKLVQDLKSSSSVDVVSASSVAVSFNSQPKGSLKEINNADNNNNNIAPSKGARMFERRQLQSSDWIVCGNDDDDDDNNTTTSKDEVGKTQFKSNLIDQQFPNNNLSQGVKREVAISRPSLSEELVMVVDENGEQMVELVPLVMSHTQPKLETATITKIPSFSASSWRVIECDSPDLLTSHDGDDVNQDTTLHSELCDDKTEDQIEDEEIGVNYSNLGASADDVSALSDLVVAAIPAAIQEGPIFQEPATNIDSCIPGEPNQLLNIENSADDDDDDGGNKRLDFNEYCGATVMRVRPQSRLNELHHATMIEWRPQVTTPARLSTVLETSVGGSASFQTEYRLTDSTEDYSIVKLKQHLPTTMDNYYTNYLSTSSTTGDHSARARSSSFTRGGNLIINHRGRPLSCSQATFKERGSGVASLRSSYQNLINESANCKYRSYHYPFEDKQRVSSSRLAEDQYKRRQQQQRSRCSSLSRYDEADYNVARRWLPPTYEDQTASHSTFINAGYPQVLCSQPPIDTSSRCNKREGYNDERATTSSSNLQTYYNQPYCQCCCHGSYTPLSDNNNNNSHLTQEKSHTSHAPFQLNSGTFYETKNFVNEHQEHASETESGTGKYARRYEQWPVASTLAPNFQSGTCNDDEDEDADSVYSLKSNRKAFLDSIRCRDGSPGLSVFVGKSNSMSNKNNSKESWQTIAKGTLQQVATANEVGSNALRSSPVPTQNLWASQEIDFSSQKSSAMLGKRLEFIQEQQQHQHQTQQQNHSLSDETTTTIHHYSHAQPTFRPSKTATTSTQTQLNFSLNDYSTNSDNNDNSLSATSDNWPTLRPPAMPQVTNQRGRTSTTTTTVEGTGTVSTAIRDSKSATPHHKLVDFGLDLNDNDYDDCGDNCCLLYTGDHLGRKEVVERNTSDHVVSSVKPESSVTPVPPPRAICDSCNAANLRVSIKLPMKVHKIIILKRPRLNYATTINQ